MATFRERLEEAIIVRDISPAELSRKSGVNEGAISQYRSGAYKASQRSLEKLSNALNVSIAWLMGADVPMERKRTSIPETSEADTRLMRITEIYNSVNEQGKTQLATQAEIIKSSSLFDEHSNVPSEELA